MPQPEKFQKREFGTAPHQPGRGGNDNHAGGSDILPKGGGGAKNRIKPRTLYLVATPIGNLADISERALKVLSGVDFIAAEDTRNSIRMLTHFGISKPLVSYFEHNKRERGEVIVSRLEAGESCALITDAGTPAISDPGEDIVLLCAGRGIDVVPIPGPCAGICALSVSGLPTGRFVFEGFLPTGKAERRERLGALGRESRTIILHEAPHKLKKTLADLAEVFDLGHKISLCRELTKLNEEIIRTTLGEAAAYYDTKEPRGEYVIVLAGADRPAAADAFWREMSLREHLDHYAAAGLEKMDAVKAVARDRGLPKNVIYKETL